MSLRRQVQAILNLQGKAKSNTNASLNSFDSISACYSTQSSFIDLPKKLKKWERKPWVTNINELKSRARLEKQAKRDVNETVPSPPENGLLVNDLIPVAHKVLAARSQLFACVSRVAETIPIHSCSVCGEVHVGNSPHKIRTCDPSGSQKSKEHTWENGGAEQLLPEVECFHIYDRVGRAVSHNERLQVDRIAAIMELCIQAGVDISEYPTRRREFPTYRVAGRIIDFEKRFPKHDISGHDISAFGLWQRRTKLSNNQGALNLPFDDIKGYAIRGMEAWEEMRSGATKLMQKYAVQTCGYCPEVQVGPKGHRVRQCQAFKHQMRDGQHAWQEATIDDVVPPVYVWHVRNIRDNSPLVDSLKRFYGKLPAVVELFAQAGAQVGEGYCGMMRDDVAVPEVDEEKLVV